MLRGARRRAATATVSISLRPSPRSGTVLVPQPLDALELRSRAPPQAQRPHEQRSCARNSSATCRYATLPSSAFYARPRDGGHGLCGPEQLLRPSCVSSRGWHRRFVSFWRLRRLRCILLPVSLRALTDTARLSGALAGRYRIERLLGAGGMATVYLAYDVRHDRHVALKELRPELAAVIGSDRFLKEIKVTAHLQHPHILGLIDSGEADGLLYYVMPFVEGQSLRDRLNHEKQLPIEDAVRITREVASALDYAHRHGVIHRDIRSRSTGRRSRPTGAGSRIPLRNRDNRKCTCDRSRTRRRLAGRCRGPAGPSRRGRAAVGSCSTAAPQVTSWLWTWRQVHRFASRPNTCSFRLATTWPIR